MIDFSPDFTERMKDKLTMYSRADERGNVQSAIEITTEKGLNQTSVTTTSDGRQNWSSDESGPSPLAYFLSSMSMCQSIHYAEHASTLNLKLKSLTIATKGTFTVSRPRRFMEIEFVTKIESEEDKNKIVSLARMATSDCFITNTLRKACKVTGYLSINGEPEIEIFD